MRISIIGNNDGPERLARAARAGGHEVIFTGLQKQEVPDEATAISLLAPLDFDLLVNCFANFRYRELHHRYPAVNVHLAPLPAYRGRHPLQWALINGEKQFGVTIHDINDNYDDGAIRWQQMVEVNDGWSAADLRERLMQLVESGFASFLDHYAVGAAGLPNDPAKASYVTRRYPEDGLLEEWSDREYLYRKVNALRDDEHQAYLMHEGRRYACTAARRGTRIFAGAVTTTVVGRSKTEYEIVCGDGLTLWLKLPGLHLRINDKLSTQ